MKYTLLAAAFLFSVVCKAQNDMPTAQQVLVKAYKQAKKENKNIILMFHASWCGWCKKMDASIEDAKCKAFFDANYVIIHLTVDESKDKKNLENPGANEVRLKFHGDKAGLPFWVVLDKEGKLLADSYTRKAGVSKDEAGDNIGCPASETEVAAFIEILKKTSSLTQEQLDIIATRFKENKS